MRRSVYQVATHFQLFIFRGVVERRAAEFVQNDSGPFSQQPAHNVDMSATGGEMQRRSSIAVLWVDVDSFRRNLHINWKC